MSHQFGNLCNHMEKICDMEGMSFGEKSRGKRSWGKCLRGNVLEEMSGGKYLRGNVWGNVLGEIGGGEISGS